MVSRDEKIALYGNLIKNVMLSHAASRTRPLWTQLTVISTRFRRPLPLLIVLRFVELSTRSKRFG